MCLIVCHLPECCYRLRERSEAQKKEDLRSLEKARAKAVRADNEIADEDEDDEMWARKPSHNRYDSTFWLTVHKLLTIADR